LVTRVASEDGESALGEELTTQLLGEPRALRASSGFVLVLAAVPVHLALSFGWALVLAAVLPRRHTVAWGTLAGLAIAALDLGIVGRRVQRIRALPLIPQVLDHVAYALTVAVVLERRARATPAVGSRAARRARPGPAAAA
jgi:hypothetical protein